MKPSKPFLHGGVCLLSLLLLLPSAVLLGDQEAASRTRIFRAQSGQEEIRAQTSLIQQEIDQLLAQLASSGISLDAAPEAIQVRDELEALRVDKIPEVIARLEQSISAAGREQDASLVAAMEGMNSIVEELRRLAETMQARETLDSLAPRIASLIGSQVTNLRQTELLEAAPDRREALAPATQLQQRSILFEVEALGTTLAALPALLGPEHQELAQRLSSLYDQRGVLDSAQQAVEALGGEDFATTNQAQTRLRESLSAMLAVLRSPEQRAEELVNASREAARIAERQQALADRAREIRPDASAALVRDEWELAAQTETLRHLLDSLDPEAAKTVAKAVEQMDASIEDELDSRKQLERAAELQEDGATLMQQASELLAERAEEVDSNPPSNTAEDANTLSALAAQTAEAFRRQEQLDRDHARLQDEMEAAQGEQSEENSDQQAQLSEEQQKVAEQQQNLAEQQEKLAEAVDALRQDIAPISPEAAQALAEAADRMLDESDRPRAVEAIAEAHQQLQEERIAAAADAAEQEALEKLAATLDRAAAAAAKADQHLEQEPEDQAARMEAFQQFVEARNQVEHAMPHVPEALREAHQALQQAIQHAAASENTEALEASAHAQEKIADALQTVAPTRSGQEPAPAGEETMPGGEEQFAGQGALAEMNPGEHGSLDQLNNSQSGDALPDIIAELLPAHEREALAVLQRETAPRDYNNQVRQYYRNLATY
ncbi:MAG: hypothetical protein ACFCU3_04475 [Verrucomicrobiales bacterium]